MTSPEIVLLALLNYFDDSTLASTIANIPKSFSDAHIIAQGWIPVHELVRFRRMRELEATAADVLAAVALLLHMPQPLFEQSPDNAYLRRAVPSLNAANIAKELASLAILAGHVVEAVGFDEGTSTAEIREHFGQFGQIVHVAVSHGSSWDPEFNTSYLVEFASMDNMIRALAAAHKYEDNAIQVRARRKPGTQSTSISASTSAQYPKNRIVEFQFESDPGAVTFGSIQTAFERFAPVKSVQYVAGSLLGHVQFKAAVASDLVNVIAHAGGIQIGNNGDTLRMRALAGDEERLHWMVKIEKTKMGLDQDIQVLANAVRLAHAGSKKRGRRGGAQKASTRYHKQDAREMKLRVDDDVDLDDADPIKPQKSESAHKTQPSFSLGISQKATNKAKKKGVSKTKSKKARSVLGRSKNTAVTLAAGGDNSLESTISKLMC